MGTPLRVLIVEDSEEDALLLVQELRRGGFEPVFKRVQTAEGLRDALDKQQWDVVLADYVMPQFSGLAAVKHLQERDLDLPFILVSAKIGEDAAVEALKAGARDHVTKGNLGRLAPAIERELREAESRREHKLALDALRESEARFRAMFEGAAISIMLVDSEGRVVQSNPAARRMTGLSEDELHNLVFSETMRSDDSAADVRLFEELVASKRDHYQIEDRYSRKDGRIIWGRVTVSRIGDREWARPFSLRMVEDITERKQAEEALRQGVVKLQRTIEETIHAIALIVEMRDPYTSGHERRVAKLATAIAREMGIDEQQVRGIEMAAIIHDVGKLYVPAEFLSKPSKLTEIEFSLIKTHAQVGHDILKTIDFSQPIAEIALQHHERVNGSGYPAGLKGEQILLEARIVGIADVVEAMASHRPYRPALGIERALEEISRNAGALYDTTVADCCKRVFAAIGLWDRW